MKSHSRKRQKENEPEGTILHSSDPPLNFNPLAFFLAPQFQACAMQAQSSSIIVPQRKPFLEITAQQNIEKSQSANQMTDNACGTNLKATSVGGLAAEVRDLYLQNGVTFNKNNKYEVEEEMAEVTEIVRLFIIHCAENRVKRKHFFGMQWSRCAEIPERYRKENTDKMKLWRRLSTKLFKAHKDDYIEVLALLFSWHKHTKLPEILRTVHGLNLMDSLLTVEQVQSMFYEVGGSYRLHARFGAAISKYTKKQIRYPSATDQYNFRSKLALTEIHKLINHSGETCGRYWPLSDSIPRCLEQKDIVKEFVFFNVDGELVVLFVISLDGAQNTSFSQVLCCLGRFANLKHIGDKPSNLLIIALDQVSESVLEFESIFNQAVMPAVEKAYKNGVPFLCTENGRNLMTADENGAQVQYCLFKSAEEQQNSSCAGCQLAKPVFVQPRLDDPEKSSYFHFAKLEVCYFMDGKAELLCLPYKNSYCPCCALNIRQKEFKATAVRSRTAQSMSPHSTEFLVEVTLASKVAFELYLSNQRSTGRVMLMKDRESHLEEFWESEEFEHAIEKNEKFGPSFKGFLMDHLTPLENYFADTLHATLNLADLVMQNLIVLLVQNIENKYPGLGIHALYSALLACGLGHLGERIRHYAKVHFKTCVSSAKMSTNRIGVKKDKGPAAQTQRQATATAFINKLHKLKKNRIHEIGLKHLPATFSKVPANKISEEMLQSLVSKLRKMKPKTVCEQVMTTVEYVEIEETAQEVFIDKITSEDGSPLDILAITVAAGLKLTGRDSDLLLHGGAAEIMIKHLNLHLVDVHAEANEDLRRLIHGLSEKQEKVRHAGAATESLLVKLESLQHMDFNEKDAEYYKQEVTSYLDELSVHSEEFEVFRKDILSIGSDIINFYYGGNEHRVELDPICALILNLFQLLKAVYTPVLKAPKNSNKDQMLDALEGHAERVLQFCDAYEESNKVLGIKFGDKSYYLHWLFEHSHNQCKRTLSRWNLHLSAFSCQSTEHFNKILKRLVERLHGFTYRAMSPKTPWKNKFGFVINEFATRFIHFFHTINVPKQMRRCTICREEGHNKRWHDAA